MAINTAEKRRSSAAVGYIGLPPGVTPNSAKDSEWRQQTARSYSGIAAGSPVTPPGPVPDEIDELGEFTVPQIAITRVGESLPFKFDRGQSTIEGWVCNIQVKKFTSDTSFISRTIEATATGWPGLLTSTETSALALGLYRLVGILTNVTTDEEEQVLLRFNMTTSWAT